ncbi:MAG: hypothetical protein ACOCVN_02730 [bacterium]
MNVQILTGIYRHSKLTFFLMSLFGTGYQYLGVDVMAKGMKDMCLYIGFSTVHFGFGTP